MTIVAGWAAVIRRVASTPSMPGMLMSMSTNAGDNEAASSTASSPDSASPTMAKPLVAPITARAAPRNGA
jgi:hypothetical protein